MRVRGAGGPSVLAGILVMLLLVSGCSSGGSTKAPRYQTTTAAELSKRLIAGKNLKESLAATRDVLALGGVATWDGKRILKEAAAPAASTLAIPEEAVVLTMEARQRASAGRLTLEELGEMLREMGWPFLEGNTPGEQLQWILEGWVRDGLRSPDDPLSFTPVFLGQMAAAQQPAVDLAKSNSYAPADLRLTLLELYLITAHFDRLGRPSAVAARERAGYAWFGRTADAAEPCSAAKEWLGEQADDLGKLAIEAGQILAGEAVGDGLGAGLKRAGFTPAGADRFGKALGALSIVARISKLVAVYTKAQIAVTVESANPVHKLLPSEGRLLSAFKATAGVSEKDWKEYQKGVAASDAIRALRDCFGAVGLPTLPDLGDLGKEAENWTVQWRLPRGMPHGFMSLNVNEFYLPGQWEMKLQKESNHSASAVLTVDITPEKGQGHTGPEKQGW